MCHKNHSFQFSQKFKPLVEEIREFYFGSGEINSEQLSQYVELLSYINFRFGAEKSLRLHAAKASGKAFYWRYHLLDSYYHLI